MDIYNSGACFIVPSLLSRKYFFTVVLGVTSLLATCGLGALTIEQISNIAQNLVRPNIFFVRISYVMMLCHTTDDE